MFNYVSLRSEFRVGMSVTISAQKRCSVRLYLQQFVGELISYLRYLCLFVHSGVLCLASCVPYVASFSGLANFDGPIDILTFMYQISTFLEPLKEIPLILSYSVYTCGIGIKNQVKRQRIVMINENNTVQECTAVSKL